MINPNPLRLALLLVPRDGPSRSARVRAFCAGVIANALILGGIVAILLLSTHIPRPDRALRQHPAQAVAARGAVLYPAPACTPPEGPAT